MDPQAVGFLWLTSQVEGLGTFRTAPGPTISRHDRAESTPADVHGRVLVHPGSRRRPDSGPTSAADQQPSARGPTESPAAVVRPSRSPLATSRWFSPGG